MAEALQKSCTICDENFSQSRPELKLPCKAHSFCKMCVVRIELHEDKKCPNCRHEWTESIVDPAYLALAELAFGNKQEKVCFAFKEKEVFCNDHDNMVLFWCQDCRDLLCTSCVTSTHRNHDFLTLQDSHSAIQETLQNYVQAASCRIEECLSAQNTQIEEADKRVARLEKLVSSIKEKISQTRSLRSSLVKS